MYLWTELRALIRHPSRALSEIDASRRIPQAALALALSLIVPTVIAEFAALAPYRPPADLGSLPSLTAQGADIYARWVYQHRFVIPVYEVLAAGMLWLLAAVVIHAGARALKGRGDLPGFFKLVGFVSLLGLVAVPVSALDALARLFTNRQAIASIGSLTGLVAVAIFTWQNALLVLAAQQHYQLSLQRALTAVLGPVGCLAILAIAILMLLIIVTVMVRPTASL